MRHFLLSLIFGCCSLLAYAQPTEFDIPCDSDFLGEHTFFAEVQIDGGLATTSDFVALFDDGGNVVGVSQIIVVPNISTPDPSDFISGFTMSIATEASVASDPMMCPISGYGASAGEMVTLQFFDADGTGVSQFLFAPNSTFEYQVAPMTTFVTGPDGLYPNLDLFSFGTILPVDFLYFRGQAAGKDALLEWATANEIDNDYFEVQHSTDGRTFVAIGQVEGFGTRNEETYYDFTDQSAVPGTNYYRLKQIDFDGASSLSGIVAINIEGASEEETITIFPNPVQNEVQADLPTSWEEGGDVRMHIVDMNGKVVQQQVFGLQPRLNFSVDAFPAGLYFVTFTNGDRTITERLMKQ